MSMVCETLACSSARGSVAVWRAFPRLRPAGSPLEVMTATACPCPHTSSCRRVRATTATARPFLTDRRVPPSAGHDRDGELMLGDRPAPPSACHDRDATPMLADRGVPPSADTDSDGEHMPAEGRAPPSAPHDTDGKPVPGDAQGAAARARPTGLRRTRFSVSKFLVRADVSSSAVVAISTRGPGSRSKAFL